MDQEEINKARAEVEASLKSYKPQPSSLEQSEQALKKAISDRNDVLVTATTITPLHKKTLTLNRTKLFAEERPGLRNLSVMSLRIEDVLNANVAVGPVSGTVRISTKFTAPGTSYSVGPFRRKDAINLKRIIQGYVIALERKIDLNPIPTSHLVPMLYDLGIDDTAVR